MSESFHSQNSSSYPARSPISKTQTRVLVKGKKTQLFLLLRGIKRLQGKRKTNNIYPVVTIARQCVKSFSSI